MSATSEYESTARQDYGPTTSSESVYKHVLEHKLTDNMNVLRAVHLSPTEGDPEPDSTNPESIIHSVNKVDKEVEYHITEKRCDTDMSVDTISGIVRIEEASLDNVGHIAYPILQETDDSSDANYVDNSATLIQAPLNTAIVQNVTKLPQNFTINMDAAVGNITAIQNVTQDVSGNQTLWLPTILTTGTPGSDSKTDDDRTQAGISQIIITSESYMSDTNQAGRRANIVSETSYISRPKTSKVQILSNISIPKTPSYTQQYITQSKDVATPVYATQNHIYKLSANVMSHKHLNNSVLSTKHPKSQSLIGCTSLSPNVINSSPIKNVSYSHAFTKNTNVNNKPLNKVNNGANLNTMVAVSSGNTQCHILSRVVSGPNKMAVHPGRKVNPLKGAKNSQVTGQKNQSRPIKIIQQTGTTHKTEGKTWPVAASITYKSQQQSYGVDTKAKIIQKIGSPTHKSQPMSLSKFPVKGERLVLQSPCGPVLISTAPISMNLPKGPHYVQSGTTPNLRYVQTYGPGDNQLPTASQVSANQQLTAQILQSLSQPKLMLHPSPTPISNLVNITPTVIEEPIEVKPINQKRIVMGDKTTLLTADDIIGMEERPNLSEELRRYSFQPLALVMLDHTYALPAQKQPSPTTPTTPVSTGPLPTLQSPVPPITTPMSPLKRNSPVIMSTASYELPITIPTSAVGPVIPVTSIQMTPLTFKPQPAPIPPDDDAASVISSLDGDRKGNRGGSDTETAPEGEEEGKTRCVCDFTHDDGYMICCDRCGEWQHVDCMGIDRLNIPDSYMCELCMPRPIDRRHARAIQLRKREELNALGASDSDCSETGLPSGQRRKRLLTVTTYTNTSGSCVTTYNSSAPVLPPLPQPALAIPKRGPKKPKKTEVVRKGTKRKLAEKRVKRKKEMMMNRNKYNSGLSNQSHWQDSYESAVTNHYSPELRAKIMKYSSKLGNTPNMAYATNGHLCTTVPHAGGKILIATKDLKENTPVIELRGKYMLSNQHRPQMQNSVRAGSQKPGPFVFFYRLPKDNTQICIDTRTYGNEARFVRRSCKPNAELQHCIVKGTLHVYLVTIGVIQANTEITVGHDTDGSKQPCACGNPKHCRVNGLNTLATRKSMDYPPREKRSRNRCFSSSSPVSPPLMPPQPAPVTPVKEMLPEIISIKPEKKSPIKHEYRHFSPVKTVMALTFDDPIKDEIIDEPKEAIDLIAKEEIKDEDEPDFDKPEPIIEVKPEPLPGPPVIEEPKPIIEEKIIEPKIEEPYLSDDEKPEKVEEPKPKEEQIKPKDEPKIEEEKPPKEVTAKSACHDRSSRSSRTTCVNQDSLDDKTDDSQDKLPTTKEKDKKKMTREERKMEAIMKAFERMEKAQQRKQEVKERQKRRESDPHPNATEKEDDEDIHNVSKKRKKRKGRARTTSQSNRRRLNSADSDMVTSGDEAPHAPLTPPRSLPPRRDSTAPLQTEIDRSSESVNEDLGLSSACLLVEAAVGSVESAFKLPKTKKTIATEWIARSPERTPSPYRSPYRPALVSAPSLESLVRVASTMIGDLSGGHDMDHEENAQASPPRTPGRDRNRPPKKSKRITRSTPPVERPEVVDIPQMVIPQHSAKKRWLRQAISEESDSPSADVFVSESPPNEMVTPLKKRRLARESLSCEQNNIVPCSDETSPILTSEDSPVKDDPQGITRHYKVRNIMGCLYGRDRTRSDSGQGSDDQFNMDHDVLNVNIKGPHDSENIRRIIGVPTPEEELPPEIKIDDIKSNNNNVELEESNYNKVPMEIDNTMPQPKIQENTDGNMEIKAIDSPPDKLNSCQSADTSGNSSPQRDEMDDIQKKIHSFHTENIQILKSRNKKPKEKRKKVNLNFDLNMVDDQISIQLRTENDSSKSPEVNGDLHDEMSSDVKFHISPENIPLPPVETIPLPAPETIPLPEDPIPISILPAPETIPLPDEPITKPVKPFRAMSPLDKVEEKYSDRPSVLDNNTLPFSSRFSSTGLFSGVFSNISQSFNLDSSINENVPNMSIIKSAIDRTTSLDSTLFEKDTHVDELKSVQEILTRVNNMDSNNSVILSGVLNSSSKSGLLSPSPVKTAKPYCPRNNDPRLNPPPVEKPKPVRRKLSITEYRKRHKGASSAEDNSGGPCDVGTPDPGEVGPEWSSSSSGAGSLSPQRLEAAAAAAVDELEQRLHKDLVSDSHLPKGVFDAQPTASERQRENLSSRLRREFGLALPEDEELRPHGDAADLGVGVKRCDR